MSNELKIRYNGDLPIATGKSRTDKQWKNCTMAWSELLKKWETPVRTTDTYAEYVKMPKGKQDNIKDVGGFVGGTLKSGRRKAENVVCRQLITLDADFAPEGFLDDLQLFVDYAYAVYSTHKHKPEKPRLRLLIPLDRPVSPEEYEAISRKVAEEIGIDYFDDTTYQPSRLMYWPSVASDAEYLFTYEDLPWLSADKVLASYQDWTDISSWPESNRTTKARMKSAKSQGDPLEKHGLIGAFCRVYSIDEVITTFLSDVYISCTMPDRYTYAAGSTAAGLVLYEDSKFAYSNHATDPVSGKLCNAFDLVRIHKYGVLDEDTDPDTVITAMPSYKKMIEFAQKDPQVKTLIVAEKQEEAKKDFEDDENWVTGLDMDKSGEIKKTLNNVNLIMQCDPNLKGVVFNQMADNLEIIDKAPWKREGRFWRDADDAQLESYLARTYAEFPKSKILTSIAKVADDRSYHPIREYLDGLPEWDGVERVDRLLIDYLGAEDNSYVRAVTRKTLCGAIHRVRFPGCKFDTVLVLCGPQGIGKSTLIAKLGGPWFSDSLNLADTKDKTAAEKLQGYWIIELGEMAGIGSAGVKTLRGFITTQDDRYRASYGRRVGSHPRQCILIGTTNSEDGYLNDVEGGRRFWPVTTPCIGHKKVWDITQEEIDQIWAETLVHVNQGESLILSGEVAEEAVNQQKAAMVSDPREEMVMNFLDTPVPKDWYLRSKKSRIESSPLVDAENSKEETMLRKRISYNEIWCECFINPEKTLSRKERFEVRAIMERMPGWKRLANRQKVPGYGLLTVYERLE